MHFKLNSDEENRFKTIGEFKECLIRGGEVEFRRTRNPLRWRDFFVTTRIFQIFVKIRQKRTHGIHKAVQTAKNVERFSTP